jgi:hypothetical protein
LQDEANVAPIRNLRVAKDHPQLGLEMELVGRQVDRPR